MKLWRDLPPTSFGDKVVILASSLGVLRKEEIYDWVLVTMPNPMLTITSITNRRAAFPSLIVYRFAMENIANGVWLQLDTSTMISPGFPLRERAFPVVKVNRAKIAVNYGRTYFSQSTGNDK